jgi:triosephosphate isomerase
MKKPIIIANWKMNLSLSEREKLAYAIKEKNVTPQKYDMVICPSSVSLIQIRDVIDGSGIDLGAQDVFWEETGAYTGEISPKILKDLNCKYAIVGHSERRQHLGETDEMINKKVEASIDNGLVPILCVGETRQERHENQTDNVILSQIRQDLKGVEIIGDESLVIAYEPVWAIGSGEVVEPDEIDRVFTLIRQVLIDTYPLTIVENNVRMVYGGSVNPDNVDGFSKLKMLDGFLVGGASLDADKFNKIAKTL